MEQRPLYRGFTIVAMSVAGRARSAQDGPGTRARHFRRAAAFDALPGATARRRRRRRHLRAATCGPGCQGNAWARPREPPGSPCVPPRSPHSPVSPMCPCAPCHSPSPGGRRDAAVPAPERCGLAGSGPGPRGGLKARRGRWHGSPHCLGIGVCSQTHNRNSSGERQ